MTMLRKYVEPKRFFRSLITYSLLSLVVGILLGAGLMALILKATPTTQPPPAITGAGVREAMSTGIYMCPEGIITTYANGTYDKQGFEGFVVTVYSGGDIVIVPEGEQSPNDWPSWAIDYEAEGVMPLPRPY